MDQQAFHAPILIIVCDMQIVCRYVYNEGGVFVVCLLSWLVSFNPFLSLALTSLPAYLLSCYRQSGPEIVKYRTQPASAVDLETRGVICMFNMHIRVRI